MPGCAAVGPGTGDSLNFEDLLQRMRHAGLMPQADEDDSPSDGEGEDQNITFEVDDGEGGSAEPASVGTAVGYYHGTIPSSTWTLDLSDGSLVPTMASADEGEWRLDLPDGSLVKMTPSDDEDAPGDEDAAPDGHASPQSSSSSSDSMDEDDQGNGASSSSSSDDEDPAASERLPQPAGTQLPSASRSDSKPASEDLAAATEEAQGDPASSSEEVASAPAGEARGASKTSRWRSLTDPSSSLQLPNDQDRVLEVVLEPGEAPASGQWRGFDIEHISEADASASQPDQESSFGDFVAASLAPGPASSTASPASPSSSASLDASSRGSLEEVPRSSSRCSSGNASLGPSNGSLVGMSHHPASIPQACLRRQGEGSSRTAARVPSHSGSSYSRVLSRLPTAHSLSQPQVPLVHPQPQSLAASAAALQPADAGSKSLLDPRCHLLSVQPTNGPDSKPQAAEPSYNRMAGVEQQDAEGGDAGGVLAGPEAAAEKERRGRKGRKARERQRMAALIVECLKEQQR